MDEPQLAGGPAGRRLIQITGTRPPEFSGQFSVLWYLLFRER
jgi:hypothetical protein